MSAGESYLEAEAEPGAGAEPAPIDQGTATPNNWDRSEPEELDLTYATEVFEYLESNNRYTREEAEAPLVRGGSLEETAECTLNPVDEQEFGGDGYAEPGFNPEGGAAPAIIQKEEEIE